MDWNEETYNTPDDVWTYRARPDGGSRYDYGVLDGDTYDLVIDTGFGQRLQMRVRAVHIDTAEIFSVSHDSDEYERGIEQRDFVRAWMEAAEERAEASSGDPDFWPLLIRTERETGMWGRWLAEVYDWDGNRLEKDIVDEFGDDVYYDE